MSVNQTARRVLAIEKKAIEEIASKLGRAFERTCELILKCRGRVVVTGMGKPGFIAQKISATLSSTGTPSLYVHPAEALHGDLGRIMKDDVVLVFSSSGETEEIVKLLPLVQKNRRHAHRVFGQP